MEHFWITGLIALVSSSWVLSRQEYTMETPDCSACIWAWNNAAYFQFNAYVKPVCFRCHLNISPLLTTFVTNPSPWSFQTALNDVILNWSRNFRSPTVKQRKKPLPTFETLGPSEKPALLNYQIEFDHSCPRRPRATWSTTCIGHFWWPNDRGYWGRRCKHVPRYVSL